jgi:hypothetical protein
MTKRVILALVACLAIAPAYGQVTIDVSKITCKTILAL